MGTTNEEAKNSIEGLNGVQGRTHQRRLRLRSRAVRSLCRHSTNKSFCREVLCNRSFCCIGPGERSGRNQRDKKNNQKVRRRHKIGQQQQHNNRYKTEHTTTMEHTSHHFNTMRVRSTYDNSSWANCHVNRNSSLISGPAMSKCLKDTKDNDDIRSSKSTSRCWSSFLGQKILSYNFDVTNFSNPSQNNKINTGQKFPSIYTWNK